jgi:hypothetical protein
MRVMEQCRLIEPDVTEHLLLRFALRAETAGPEDHGLLGLSRLHYGLG